jgi:Alpha/beta hydrolase
MSFSMADVVAAAGVGNPWDRAQDVATADPGAVTAMAGGFGEAAGHARTALAAAQRADPITADGYLVDQVPVHDAAAATAATRTALGDGGEHPAEIARMLTSVAGELTGTQNGVRSAITALDGELQAVTAALVRFAAASSTLTPADAAAAERALFDRAVAAVRTHGGRVNALLEDYDGVLASRTGLLAGLGYARPATPAGAPPVPPAGGTPQQNSAWWLGLSPAQREEILATNPKLVGNLDGIPAKVRDQANRAQLDSEAARLDGEIARARADVDAALDQGFFPSVFVLPRAEAEKARLATLLEQRAALTAVQDTVAQGDRQLLLLDISGHAAPRAAVAVGNVDTADHVAVFTPGLETTVTGEIGNYTNDAVGIVQSAEQQLTVAQGMDHHDTVAVVTWIGYDAPQLDTTFDADRSVALPYAAQHGGADLGRFYDGINASRPYDDPHLTALGHSYGSTTTGYGLQSATTPVDDVVLFGSPGASTNDITDLKVPPGHVAVIEARGDPVADLGAFGDDPNHLDGVVNLSAHEEHRGSTQLDESTGHSAYLRPNTTSQYNIAATVAGLPGNRIEGANSGAGDELRAPDFSVVATGGGI